MPKETRKYWEMKRDQKPLTIAASKITNSAMVAGLESKISRVVDGDELMEWVGIGWVAVRQATAKDRRVYHHVVRPAP